MSDLTDWIQGNWFELASLTAQFAILAVMVWYARTVMGTSRRRVDAEPQPSEASNLPAVSPSYSTSYAPAQEQPAGFGGVGRMLSPMPEPEVQQAAAARCQRGERTNPWRAMVKWLQAPMTSRTPVAWRRLTRQVS